MATNILPHPSETESRPEYWYEKGRQDGRNGLLPLRPEDIPRGNERPEQYLNAYDAGYEDGRAQALAVSRRCAA